MEEEKLERRFRVLRFTVALIFLTLVVRLGYLELVKGDYYEQAARENRIRVLPIPAPRGQIFDRNGKPLAVNRPAYTVSLVDMGNGNLANVVAPLAQLIGMKPEEIQKKIDANQNRLFEPIRIANQVSIDIITKIEERRSDLPGVYVEYVPIREYPNGDLLAHTLGYLGEVSPEDLESWAKSYKIGDIVGKAGLERSYEETLRGTDGGTFVEVDSNNQLIRVLGREEPTPGNDIYLTIDLDLQKTAEDNLKTALQVLRTEQWSNVRAPYAYSGSVVAVDPNNGEILAMASYPNFDPNQWATGRLENEALRIKYLIGDEQYPNAMLNRAVLAALPPGSTFKPVTAAAALETGVVSASETVFCNGFYSVVDPDNPSRCWNWDRGGHGLETAEHALRDSCNVYFYEMGRRLGPDRLASYAKMFGLGEDTGLTDLLHAPESDPSFTHRSDTAYKEWAYEQKLVDTNVWYPGESIYSAIGQQYSAYTPLQMAQMTATIATKGTRYKPYLVTKIAKPGGGQQVVNSPKVLATVDLKPETWQIIHQGMVEVTQYGGTSYSISFGDNPALTPWRDIPVTVAGKTGTAQIANDPSDIRAHGWFISFAPAEKPKIAIAMVIEHGRGGSASSAPTVSAMVKQYLGYNKPAPPATPPANPSTPPATPPTTPPVTPPATPATPPTTPTTPPATPPATPPTVPPTTPPTTPPVTPPATPVTPPTTPPTTPPVTPPATPVTPPTTPTTPPISPPVTPPTTPPATPPTTPR